MVGGFIKVTPMFPPLQTVENILHETILKVQFSKITLKIKTTKTFNFLIVKMIEPKIAWLQIGEPAITLPMPFMRSEFKVFQTFWKEFVLLEYIKIQDEQGVISYLGLRPFILLNKVWISTLIQQFPDGRGKKKKSKD